jgi:gas vesicle protein
MLKKVKIRKNFTKLQRNSATYTIFVAENSLTLKLNQIMKKSELLFLLAGVSLGALAGILFAPDKGENTREKIAKKAGEAKHEFEEKSAELRKDFARKSAELKKELEEQVEVSKGKIQKFAESIATPIKEKLKEKSTSATEPVKEA